MNEWTKKLAEQAGLWPAVTDMFPKELERFTELILEQERKEAAKQHLKFIRECVEQEREACAKVCDEYDNDRHANAADLCAAAIRARGQA